MQQKPPWEALPCVRTLSFYVLCIYCYKLDVASTHCCLWTQYYVDLGLHFQLFGASLSEPRIHEVQEAVLYVNIYRIAPNFRGTIFSWISWFDFWSRKFSSRKFSIIVGVATFCVHRRIASAIVRKCDYWILVKWAWELSEKSLLTISVCLLSENEQKLRTKSARIFI